MKAKSFFLLLFCLSILTILAWNLKQDNLPQRKTQENSLNGHYRFNLQLFKSPF
jgi:hypothetical protein